MWRFYINQIPTVLRDSTQIKSQLKVDIYVEYIWDITYLINILFFLFIFLTLSTHKATLLPLNLQSWNGSSSGQSIMENTGAPTILTLVPKALIPHKERQIQKYSAPKARELLREKHSIVPTPSSRVPAKKSCLWGKLGHKKDRGMSKTKRRLVVF